MLVVLICIEGIVTIERDALTLEMDEISKRKCCCCPALAYHNDSEGAKKGCFRTKQFKCKIATAFKATYKQSL